MSMEDESRVRELLPTYVLDLLTDEDTILVAQHLASCSSCREELAHLQQIADDLPLAMLQADPPPALKNKIMAEIHSRNTKAMPVSQPAHLQPTFWQRIFSQMQRIAPVFAVALIALLVIVNLSLWKRLNQMASQPTPAMRVIALVNTDAAPSAKGTLILDQLGQYGTLVVDSLQVLNPDQQYQVWLIQSGERTSGGLFSVNHEGYGSVELWAPQSLNQYDAIGITIEPAGGSPGPTGVKVLGGNITN